MLTLPATFTAKLVGASFVDEYPQNILACEFVDDPTLELVHNPDNEFDSNAIEVRREGRMLGHLPRAAAARVAAEIGEHEWTASIVEVLINPEHQDKPGLLIRCERKSNG